MNTTRRAFLGLCASLAAPILELAPVVALSLLPLGLRWAGIPIPLWLATAPIWIPLVTLYLFVYGMALKHLCTPTRKDAKNGNDPG